MILLQGGCASLPPDARAPKAESSALADWERTPLGAHFQPMTLEHPGESGYRLLPTGIDGLTARIEMIDAAARTLDLQYYIFRGDTSGDLVAEALLRAARRGVRIRLLIDDADTTPGDERILSLTAAHGIEVRIFNPFAYRGHNRLLRGAEFVFNKKRLDYRMHNKLLVLDNAAAIIGGRNVGNQYFEIDPHSQFGDDDAVVAGPMVRRLSEVFDQFWNGALAVPARAVDKPHTSEQALRDYEALLAEDRRRLGAIEKAAAVTPAAAPFSDIVAGRARLVWARAELTNDSPDKKDIELRGAKGRLIYRPVLREVAKVETELLMISPYFVPAPDELDALGDAIHRGAKVRILTNSLPAAPNLAAHAGYTHYRTGLLSKGAQLYEERALIGNVRGSGEGRAIAKLGNYGLHAKLYIFDRKALFIGSMNFDQRSKHLNTEIGLLIASPELSRQTAQRFDDLTSPDDAYALRLQGGNGRQGLVWTTRESGTIVEYRTEPARSPWQRWKAELLAWLPIDREL